jgi:hypothetical protein
MIETSESPKIINLAQFDSLDLEPIKYKLIYPENLSAPWSLAYADNIGQQYVMFLKLCKLYPEKVLAISRAIDEMWHMHILDTIKYHDDCEKLFGYYLHHYPYLDCVAKRMLNILSMQHKKLGFCSSYILISICSLILRSVMLCAERNTFKTLMF